MAEEPNDSERLREAQAERSRREAELAEEAPSQEERDMHARRADKAEYLHEKLEEQAERE
jgi:hypothetical protein